MRRRRTMPHLCALLAAALLVLQASPALATQGHGGIEGVYIHQLAHLFFMLSMAILIFRLREERLVAHKGWRYIQYAAFLFILWNIDAFVVHLLDDQLRIVQLSRLNAWQLRVTGPNHFLVRYYYMAKLDHLLCVPALWFLYLGLKHLLAEARRAAPGEKSS